MVIFVMQLMYAMWSSEEGLRHLKTVYPNKVFDYMSCEKPILLGIDGVQDSSGVNAGNGIYIEPENVMGYNSAVNKLYKDREPCRSMGINGYNFCKSNFSREALATKYEAHLLELLGKG